MKIRCLILDNLNANGALRMAGTEHELDLAEADIEMLIDCRVIELLNNPVSANGTDPSAPASVPAAEGADSEAASSAEVMLIGSSVQPSMFDLDGQSYTLGELVVDAQRASGLPGEAWNELPDDEREALIEAARIRIGAERLEFVERAAGEAKPATVDVLIDAPGGGELDPVAVNAAVATAIDAAKPARKGK